MPRISCPHCGRQYVLGDEMAGRRVKCVCGASFRIPGSTSTPGVAAGTLPVAASLYCPHCNEEIKPNWRACPACGEKLPIPGPVPGTSGQEGPKPSPSQIRAGDTSVVKAVLNLGTNAEAAGKTTPVNPGSSAQPMISAGSESVVKAEIDASYNVSVAGDVVAHKVTNVQESWTAGVAKVFQVSDPARELRETLAKEFEAAQSSDSNLVAFITHQITAIESTPGCHENLVSIRSGFAADGLEMLAFRCECDPKEQSRIRVLRSRLERALTDFKSRSRANTQLFFKMLLGLGAVGVLCFVSLLCLAVREDYSKNRTREDVQMLIRDGKFDEARIRAQDLDGSQAVQRMMKAIEDAEKSRRTP